MTESLDSLLGQSFRDFELIVVDDGSTDDTPDILRGFDDPRMRVLRNPTNRGLTPSLNRGWKEARGEFIARQDADDVSEPDRLERQLEYFRENPEVVMAGSWYRKIDSSGREIEEVRLPSDLVGLRWCLLFYCPFVHSAAMWRRVPVEREVGMYDDWFQYAMDHDLWNRIAARFPVGNVEDYLVRYRIGPHSMTSNHPRTEIECRAVQGPGVAELMGWDLDREPGLRRRFDRLFSLLYAPELPETFDDLEEARSDLEELHRRFARNTGLSPEEAKRHLGFLKHSIASRMIREARIQREAGNGAWGRTLYREGLRFDRGVFLSTRSARYLVGALLGLPRPRTP